MRIHSLQRWMKSCLPAYLVIFWMAVGNFVPLSAHSGEMVFSDTEVSTTITINGEIASSGAEAVWAPGLPAGSIPNSCAEFNGAPPAPTVNLFTLNDGVNLFLAFDIPDSSANANDALFLFMDPNHNAGTSPEGGATPDRAIKLTFNNTAAPINSVPAAENFTGTGAGWSAAISGLPAGVDAKYMRTPTGRWQVELRLPFTAVLGFAYFYANETGTVVGDCNFDGDDDDFFAKFPSTLPTTSITSLPADIANPTAWGDLNFGPQPPTVGFNSPFCCHSADIIFSPSGQPFTAGVPVSINARVHNFHTSSTANNVNVEIRVHNFGTGGAVIPPFPIATQIPSIAPTINGNTPTVTWPSPPAGLHGCIRAEIKPPTTSQYFITAGANLAQHNTDVACVPAGGKKLLKFVTFNPEPKQDGVKITLIKQVLLPDGFRGLTFEIQQPDRPLKALEEFPVQMIVTAAADTPLTQLPVQKAQVPPTAGGTAAPPLHGRSGTDSIVIPVKSGDRLHLAATGEVDIDGGGTIPASGPDGQDVSKTAGERRPLLLRGESASHFGGALIGSFDNFATSFVIGAEATFTVPSEIRELRLAVNDFDAGFGDNSGKGFEVTVSTLPAFEAEAGPVGAAPATAAAAPATKVTLPQVNITATSRADVKVGNWTYNFLTNHGGATYQLLVVKGDGHESGTWLDPGKYGMNKLIIFGLLLLLIIIVIIILSRKFSRKKHAT